MRNLCSNLGSIGRGIKDRNLLCSIFALREGIPELGKAIPHGADHTQTCNHDPFSHFTPNIKRPGFTDRTIFCMLIWSCSLLEKETFYHSDKKVLLRSFQKK